jgi:hypothetical protein
MLTVIVPLANACAAGTSKKAATVASSTVKRMRPEDELPRLLDLRAFDLAEDAVEWRLT